MVYSASMSDYRGTFSITSPLSDHDHILVRPSNLVLDKNINCVQLARLRTTSSELNSNSLHLSPCPRFEEFPSTNEKSAETTIRKSGIVLDHKLELSFDQIEKELAKVCGEGNENVPTDPKHFNSTNPCAIEKSKAGQFQEVEFTLNGLKHSSPTCIEIETRKLAVEKKNWRLERIKNEANLEKRLKMLEEKGVEKRIRIEKRFLVLFGPDKLTVNSSDSKKKDAVAGYVVKHLMPFYKKQRVANKDLFKKLAKHISDSLMERLISPSEKDVQARVQEYFQNGKSVNIDEDICCHSTTEVSISCFSQ